MAETRGSLPKMTVSPFFYVAEMLVRAYRVPYPAIIQEVVRVNVKLLRKVKKHILKNPERLYMDEGILVGEPGEELPHWNTTRTFAQCGTAACIAGWACILSGSNPRRLARHPWRTISPKARRLIGIKGDPDFLFRQEQWPSKFANAFECAPTAEKQAQITAARIDHFIKTGN